jgi:oligopeptide/dipeptide ABC transporter ATP-binding protein
MQVGKQLYEAYAIHHREISRKACYKKVLELLDLVGIPDPEERYLQYPFELSGGMCQRIMIALALAPEPKILIADEPTTAIDVTIQSQILSLLDELQQKLEMSIIFITHNLSLIAGFCDHALVIYAGKIVESASIQTLFYHPRHPYTKRLLASIPGIHKNKDEALNPIDGSIPDLSKEYPHCNFFDRCPKAMNICQIQAPPLFSTGDGGVCSCWLQDPRKRAS